MPINLKVLFTDFLKKHGFHVNQSPYKETLNELLLKLKPVNCGIELIRLGGNNDGGYLIPDDLGGIKYCFSPGVDIIANFENDCLKRGIRSFLADYSVDQPPINLEGCEFIKKYVGAYNNSQTITMDDWVSQSLPDEYKGDLILQMDIEGAEYETLLATPVSILKRFRIIILELHNFQKLSNTQHYHLVNAFVEKLKEHFESVHIHMNNFKDFINVNGIQMPPYFEVTLLRKDRVKRNASPVLLPHPLDQPNCTDKKDLKVPAVWAS